MKNTLLVIAVLFVGACETTRQLTPEERDIIGGYAYEKSHVSFMPGGYTIHHENHVRQRVQRKWLVKNGELIVIIAAGEEGKDAINIIHRIEPNGDLTIIASERGGIRSEASTSKQWRFKRTK